MADWTAALNHLSLKKGHIPYYAALHNLAVWAAHHGTPQELEDALENLKPALSLLNTYRERHFAKYKGAGRAGSPPRRERDPSGF